MRQLGAELLLEACERRRALLVQLADEPAMQEQQLVAAAARAW